MLFKSIALIAGVFPPSVAALSLHLNAPNRPPGSTTNEESKLTGGEIELGEHPIVVVEEDLTTSPSSSRSGPSGLRVTNGDWHEDCASSISEHVEVSTEPVDGNAGGATLRVLYAIARECEDVTECSDGISRSRNSVFFNWEWWARTALWPLALQAIALYLLYEILDEQWSSGNVNWNDKAKPSIFFTVALLTVFNYGWFQWLTGPFMKCVYAVDSIKFKQHPHPIRTRLAAYGLFAADTLVGLATAILGWIFLVFAPSKDSLLLNALALFFILDIDDSVAKLTPNIGLMHEIMVPSHVVLPKYIYNPRWYLKSRFFWPAMVVQFGFLSTPAIPVALSVLAYYIVSGQWNNDAIITLASAIPASALLIGFGIARPKMQSFLKEGKKDLLQKMFDRIHKDIKKLGAEGEDFISLLYSDNDEITSMDVTNDWSEVNKHMWQLVDISKSLTKKEADFISLVGEDGPSFSLKAGIKQLDAKIRALKEVDYEHDVNVKNIQKGAITVDVRKGHKGFITAVNDALLPDALKVAEPDFPGDPRFTHPIGFNPVGMQIKHIQVWGEGGTDLLADEDEDKEATFWQVTQGQHSVDLATVLGTADIHHKITLHITKHPDFAKLRELRHVDWESQPTERPDERSVLRPTQGGGMVMETLVAVTPTAGTTALGTDDGAHEVETGTVQGGALWSSAVEGNGPDGV